MSNTSFFKQSLIDNSGFWQAKPDAKYLALLTSGLISDVFCNTGVVTNNPAILERVVLNLIYEFGSFRTFPKKVCFVGPAIGAITWAWSIASNYCDSFNGTSAVVACPEKDSTAEHGWKFRSFPTDCDAVVLCEDVVTTGSSLKGVLNTVIDVLEGQGSTSKILDTILCLVNRSGQSDLTLSLAYPKFKLVSCLVVQARTFSSLEEAQVVYPNAVEAIRPKQNWEVLVNG